MIIAVLNDGETYSALDGCKFVQVPKNLEAEGPDGIEKWLKDGNVGRHTLAEFHGELMEIRLK